jgi:disulfide bond formation protein DsbB
MSTVAVEAGEKVPSRLVQFLQLYGPYLALVPALTAMLGSLYYSEIAGFFPCTLCWYQRILMYPLSLIILVGIIKQDDYLPSYVLPLSITGIFVSSYHYLIERGVFAESSSCVGVSCAIKYVEYFGFITIPFMALTAFILITAIMGATVWANRQAETE